MTEDHAPYVTTTFGGSGYFAVMMHWHSDGFWEPLQTGCGRYRTRDAAVDEAKAWAVAENVEYRP